MARFHATGGPGRRLQEQQSETLDSCPLGMDRSVPHSVSSVK